MRAFVAILALLVLPVLALGQAQAGFIVIVHPRNPESGVSKRFLSDAYLKRRTRWSHEALIEPVDLPPGAAARRAFSDRILGRSVSAVRSFWQQRIFSGRDLPPVELSAAEAVRYVLTHRGAVAYVPIGIEVQGTKILRVD